MNKEIYTSIFSKKQNHKKGFAILLDPDNISIEQVKVIIDKAEKGTVDYFLVGGSIILDMLHFQELVVFLKNNTQIPVVLFPGNLQQIHQEADALLLLSLISGRNPELLIGQHVLAAPMLKKSKLEVIPTAYLLIDGGKETAVTYMSNTKPIPANKPEIAISTAMAGELLGLQLLYVETGSGADSSVPVNIIKGLSREIDIPLIVGGGIRDVKTAQMLLENGADIVVVGNHIEENIDFIEEMSQMMEHIHS
ncbi:MAG: geranylgeranylglyceryl/heptaprenylglyceryl phosphate synthase [Cytophagales bacterium]|nr:geranylgeranylglyceryl/heptaprenylglyceryl phosphate synthase [Cytophagales bacterium]